MVNANALTPIGAFNNRAPGRDHRHESDQLRTADEYRDLVVKTVNGAVVRLWRRRRQLSDGVRNRQVGGLVQGKPAVLLLITKAGDANVIDTVDRIKALLPQLKEWLPAGIDFTIFSDRTRRSAPASHDMQ